LPTKAIQNLKKRQLAPIKAESNGHQWTNTRKGCI